MTAEPTFDREIAVAQELSVRAGKHILRYHGAVDVHRKAGNEPVTIADRESSDMILEGLRKAFPNDVLISEEEPDNPARMEPGARVWFVDPLDGTSDFIRGNEGFSVMIGLVTGGRPRLGVVYQPVGERLYSAAPGLGARLTSPEGSRRLAVSQIADLSAIRLVASKSHRSRKMDDIKATLGIDDELNIGSVGLKLGLIARGDRDLYVHPSSKCKAWDTCAPEAILHEAGGTITDLHGNPLVYTEENLWNSHGLLASNGALHEAVVKKLAPLFPRPG